MIMIMMCVLLCKSKYLSDLDIVWGILGGGGP